jgi:hypothetical protein
VKGSQKDPLKAVHAGLQAYADRGVFRGFSEGRPQIGKASFSFLWMSPRRLDFIVDTGKGTLTFKHLFPNVPSGSIIHKDLKRFLAERYNGGLPSHRRLDKKRAEIICTNRNGAISLSIKVKNEDYRYCLNKIVNLVHELFVHLGDSYDDYMCENFDARQE